MDNSTDPIAIVGIHESSDAERREALLGCAEALCARRRAQEIGLFMGVSADGDGDDSATDLARRMGLPGPAVTVTDELCPVLAAVDRACQSLRRAEHRLALVTEVPAATAGALLLARLGDALLQGAPIIATIHGSLTAGQTTEPSGAAAEVRPDEAAISDLLAAVRLAGWGLADVPGGETASTRRVVATATRDGRTTRLVLGPPPAPRPAGARKPDAEKRPRPALARAYATPANPLEAAVAELWQEVLGVQPVGVHDNFLELGGDSITGVKIIAALREWLQLEIPTASLYDAPTVATLAWLIATGATPRAVHDQDDVQARGERRRAKLQRLAQEKLATPAVQPGTAGNESS